ncbi:WAT1-related protein At1g68170-like [Quercus robur]|uniref:WAT1-related protein At1g68170-like n=1 Tax=Quercus robur TaxID=38942 RepID=UPI0021632CCC|nr:WAT1-related protein At1g68170-like [Quercus robur]
MELRVEFATTYNSLLRSTSHGWNILLSYMGNCNSGPIYGPMFSPLSLIFVSILEALILGAEIRLGMLLGSVLIIVGLYSFLWGKRKEMKSLLQTNNDTGSVVAPTTAGESAVV